MKINEFLDKTDEKIDYLFKHGKNADERCYDFFIRTVTFFVVVLIVLCYGSFVHAEEVENEENYSTFTEGFTNGNYLTWVNSNNIDTTNFTSIGIMQNQTYNTDVFNSTNFANLPNPTNYSVLNVPTVLGIGSGGGTINSASNRWGVKYCIGSGDIILSSADGGVYAYSDTPFTVYHTQLNNNLTMYDGWGWETFNASLVTSNYDSNISCYRALLYSTYNQACWCNCPYYTFNVPVDSWNASYDLVYAFVNYRDNWININYEYATQYPEIPEEPDYGEYEGNSSNYLYSNNNDIYLSRSLSFLNSNILFSCSGNDFIKDNIDLFYMDITYNMVFQGGFVSHNQNENYTDDINDTFTQRVSLSNVETFYSYSISDLFNAMNYGGDTLNSLFSHLNQSFGITIPSKESTSKTIYYIGLSDTLDPAIKTSVSTYKLNIPSGSFYKVNKAYLNVTFKLGTSENFDVSESYKFSKTFNLLDGSESITNDAIGTNPNPYLGDDGEYHPLPDNVGNSGSGGGNVNITGNSINIKNGEGYKDTALHQLSEEDIQNNHRKIIEVIQDMKETVELLSDESEQSRGGFLQMLRDEYEYIPGVDYIVDTIIILCGIAVIVFILKVIF